MTDRVETGYGGGLLLGYGGKIRGLDLFRFYLASTLTYDRFSALHERTGGQAEVRYGDLTWAVGPRIYLAFSPRVRLFFDVFIGGYRGSSEWTFNGLEHYSTSDSGLALSLGAGLQYRVRRWLSLGFRIDRADFKGRINEQNMAGFLGFSMDTSEAQHARTRVGLSLGIHF